jgi:hypothetical protein
MVLFIGVCLLAIGALSIFVALIADLFYCDTIVDYAGKFGVACVFLALVLLMFFGLTSLYATLKTQGAL